MRKPQINKRNLSSHHPFLVQRDQTHGAVPISTGMIQCHHCLLLHVRISNLDNDQQIQDLHKQLMRFNNHL